ncbi:hypothetical protein [Sphingomonas sp. 1P08PE]
MTDAITRDSRTRRAADQSWQRGEPRENPSIFSPLDNEKSAAEAY